MDNHPDTLRNVSELVSQWADEHASARQRHPSNPDREQRQRAQQLTLLDA